MSYTCRHALRGYTKYLGITSESTDVTLLLNLTTVGCRLFCSRVKGVNRNLSVRVASPPGRDDSKFSIARNAVS